MPVIQTTAGRIPGDDKRKIEMEKRKYEKRTIESVKRVIGEINDALIITDGKKGNVIDDSLTKDCHAALRKLGFLVKQDHVYTLDYEAAIENADKVLTQIRKDKTSQPGLSAFTDEELVAELISRGYTGEVSKPKVIKLG